MPAGEVLIGQLWRTTYPQDDSVGGAVPTGTPLYYNLQFRMRALKPTQALLEQGLETPTIFTVTVHPSNINVQENDLILITAPNITFYYQKFFRILGIQRQSNGPNDFKSPLVLTVRRFEKSRTQQ